MAEICSTLPEATFEPQGLHAALKVRGRTFAWFLDDHHGDGIVAVTFEAPGRDNHGLIAADPERFYMPSYLGPRGWVALRLDTTSVDWTQVSDFVTDSYLMTAPKRLAAALEAT